MGYKILFSKHLETNVVTYETFPATAVVQLSVIVCKARGRNYVGIVLGCDANYLKHLKQSFTKFLDSQISGAKVLEITEATL